MTNSEESTSVLTSYRITWEQKGIDKSHTETCIVDSNDVTRPGDPEQRNGLLRQMLAIRHLPGGQVVADNIVLLDVIPLCNCEPYPIPENCAYAENKGDRFYLTVSTQAGYEVVRDRHRNRILGNVSNVLSVDFLTLIRQKYGHQ